MDAIVPYISLIIIILGGLGWLIKRQLSKPLESAQIKNVIADANGKTISAGKTEIETIKLSQEIKKLASSQELENVTAFATQIQALLLFAKEQGADHARERDADQQTITELRISLKTAQSTIDSQNKLIENQAIIAAHEGRKYETLHQIYGDTVRQLDGLADKYKMVSEERDQYAKQSSENQKKYEELYEEHKTIAGILDEIRKEVERLKRIMKKHNINPEDESAL